MKSLRIIAMAMAMFTYANITADTRYEAGVLTGVPAVMVEQADSNEVITVVDTPQAGVLTTTSDQANSLIPMVGQPQQPVQTLSGQTPSQYVQPQDGSIIVAVYAGDNASVAVEANAVPADSVERGNYYYYVTKEDDIAEVPRAENAYYLEIKFRWDKWDLDMNYMGNQEVLDFFKTSLDSIGFDNIIGVEIISQSSPEGVYEHNMMLSERRSATMKKYMHANYPELDSLTSINPDGEAWLALRNLVENDAVLSDKSRQKVLDVIDADVNVGTKKWRMENVLGSDAQVGNVYKYLYKTYYPKIRYSGITVNHYVDLIPIVIDTPQVIEPIIMDTVVPEPVDTVVPVIPEPVWYRFPKLSAKTNLLYDAFFTPKMGYAPVLNVEFEYYLTEHGRWSITTEYDFPWWVKDSKHQYLQILNWDVMARRYFKADNNWTGWFLTAGANANLYDVCVDEVGGAGKQGEGAGVNFGLGYVMPLNQKGNWKLEFYVLDGCYVSKFDQYDAGDPFQGKYYYRWYQSPNLFQPRRNTLSRLFLPTGGGVRLSYDFIYRKRQAVQY